MRIEQQGKKKSSLLLYITSFWPLRKSQGEQGNEGGSSVPPTLMRGSVSSSQICLSEALACLLGVKKSGGLKKGKCGRGLRSLPGSSTFCKPLHCRSYGHPFLTIWALMCSPAIAVCLSPQGGDAVSKDNSHRHGLWNHHMPWCEGAENTPFFRDATMTWDHHNEHFIDLCLVDFKTFIFACISSFLACIYVYHLHAWCPWRSVKSIRSLWTIV